MNLTIRFLIVLCLVSFLVPVASAATIRVPYDQTTIGAAIAAASSSGDTILVYPPPSPGPDYYGEHDLDLGTKNIVIRSALGPSVTIINCQLNGRCFRIAGGQTNATVIQGFKIINGQTDLGGKGGAFYLENVNAQIKQCVVVSCEAPNDTSGEETVYSEGGGLYAYGGSPLVQGCEFYQCTANEGGGMFFDGGIPSIISNEVHGCTALAANTSGNHGGGGIRFLFESASPATFSGNYLHNNVVNGKHDPHVSKSVGGGLYLTMGYDVGMHLNTNMFKWNKCQDEGGGCRVGGSGGDTPLWFTSNEFIGNSTDPDPNNLTTWGGGLAVINACVVMVGDSFAENSSYSGMGGAIYCAVWSADISLDRLTISNNIAKYGGGIYAWYTGDDIVTCTNTAIFGNGNTLEGSQGGGAYVGPSAHAKFDCTTFQGNMAEDEGGGIYVADYGGDYGEAEVHDCILWADTPDEDEIAGGGVATVTYSDVDDDDWSGGTNIKEDPSFTDEYHIGPYSPCREAGDPVTLNTDHDIDVDARPYGDVIDMGCDEYTP